MCIANDAAQRHAALAPRRREVGTPSATAPARRSAGFTLLEILLASLLGALVLMAVVTAIDVHFRVYDTSRANVEEAQLARALLGRIAADLRGAIQYDPIQADKLVSNTSSSSSSGSSGSSDSTTSTDTSDPTASTDASADDSQSATASTSMTNTDLSASSVPMTVPGLYGNQSQMQVDVSRLPRIDQLEAMLQAADDSSPYDRPSDVKTVTYYVNSPNSPTMLGLTDSALAGTGLIRRELDRAVTAFASQQGDTSAFDMNLPPLAPEVNAIQFSYFDGTDWYQEWDSSSQGKLPTAVQVTIAITPVRRNNNAGPLSWLNSSAALDSEPDPAHMYCLLVQLPGAQPPRTYGSSGSSDQSEEESTDASTQQSSQDMTSAAPATAAPTSSPSSPAQPGGSSGPGGGSRR